MKRPTILLLCMFLTAFVYAQESDYTVLQSFQQRAAALRTAMDSASTPQTMDAIKPQIDALALDFQAKKEFLDKALAPDTFDGTIASLRKQFDVAYARTSEIQTQGVRILELETTIQAINSKLDTLSQERTQLFADLQEAKKNVSALRETVRRLTANLQANDRLIFSMVDSIFLPYDKNMSQASDIEKERLAGTLQQSNVLARISAVANDNLRFLETTQFQPKDYASLVDQYQAFQARWNGLSERLREVAAASERRAAAATEKKGGKSPASTLSATASTQVDSALSLWKAKLMQDYWSGLEREFTDKGITINHFTDGPSFAASVNALVASYKQRGGDVDTFVDDVWRERVDKEWRESLVKDGVLGRVEYAALDKSVSELVQKTIDFKLILYALGIIVIAVAIWWVVTRKTKTQPPPPAPAA